MGSLLPDVAIRGKTPTTTVLLTNRQVPIGVYRPLASGAINEAIIFPIIALYVLYYVPLCCMF